MSTNRRLFKATTMAALTEQATEVADLVSNSFEGIPFHTIVDQVTSKFRMYPAHPGEKSFVHKKVVHWLNTTKNNKDNIPETKRRPVYNGRIHGGLDEDIVEIYIDLAKEIIEEEVTDSKEKVRLLKVITDGQKGITAKLGWVGYADHHKNGAVIFGLLDMTNSLKESMENCSVTKEGEDAALVPEPFTDPDTGVIVLVTKNTNLPGNKMYQAKTGEELPLTDAQLDYFMEVDTLSKKYTNVYHQGDFEDALEGLTHVDQLLGMQITALDEFQAAVEAIQKQVPPKPVAQTEQAPVLADKIGSKINTPKEKVEPVVIKTSRVQKTVPVTQEELLPWEKDPIVDEVDDLTAGAAIAPSAEAGSKAKSRLANLGKSKI